MREREEEEEEEEEKEEEEGTPLGNIAGVPACALFPAAASEAFSSSDAKTRAWDPSTPQFNARALQGWILSCCQAPNGGLQARPIHWFPYDRVGVVHVDP